MTLSHSVFLRLVVVLFLWLQVNVTSFHVPPPTNVTLHCHNMRNILEWNYNTSSPGIKFRVDIGQVSYKEGIPKVLWVSPPDLKADVSFLSDPNNDYFLQLTAVDSEGRMSEPAPPDGIAFSYFMESPAGQKCYLDSPPINIQEPTNNIHELKFSFKHPWLLYWHSSTYGTTETYSLGDPMISNELPVFKYTVSINQEAPYEFKCMTAECGETLPVGVSLKKHCLTISGELKNALVKGTREYCKDMSKHPMETKVIILIAMAIVVFFIAVLVILWVVYRKQTQPHTQPLPFLAFGRAKEHGTLIPESEAPQISPVSQVSKKETSGSSSDTDSHQPLRDEGSCVGDDQQESCYEKRDTFPTTSGYSKGLEDCDASNI